MRVANKELHWRVDKAPPSGESIARYDYYNQLVEEPLTPQLLRHS